MFAIGGVISSSQTGSGYKRAITIDHTKVSNSDQTNFPVLFSGTYNGSGGILDLRTEANGGRVSNSNGYDILFYSDSSLRTPLDFERVFWNATTGECEFWVKVPTVSASVDTTIYISYGTPSINQDRSTQTIWDTNYKGIYHLKDGTTLSVSDSTNQNNGTNNGATATTGKIDGGTAVDGTQYIIAKSTGGIIAGVNWTISVWMNTTVTFIGPQRAIYSERASSGTDIIKLDFQDSTSQTQAFITLRNDNGTLLQTRGATSINDGIWHYVVGVKSGTSVFLYVDGNQDNTTGVWGGTDSYTDSLQSWIGADPGDTNSRFLGSLDEVRLSTSARSADSIKTEYNNQNNPSSFYSIGSEGLI